MSVSEFDPQLDKITDKELNLTLRQEIAISYAHVNNTLPHITAADRTLWNNKWDYTTAARVTQSTDGIMKAEDKIKLDGIEEGANKYTHPNSGVASGSYTQVSVNSQGHVITGSNPSYLKIRVNDSDNLGGSAASTYAKLDSPTFTGTPIAPTAASATSNDQIATTKYVSDNFLRQVFSAGSSAPTDKRLLWINTSNGTINYFNSSTGSWVPATAKYASSN